MNAERIRSRVTRHVFGATPLALRPERNCHMARARTRRVVAHRLSLAGLRARAMARGIENPSVFQRYGELEDKASS